MAFFTKSPDIDVKQLIRENDSRLNELSLLVQRIHGNKALYYLGKGFDYIIEYVCYLLGIASVGFVFIMNSVFPFHILGEIMSKQVLRENIANSSDLNIFDFAVKGLVIVIGVLFVLLGIMKNRLRSKKQMIQDLGKVLKSNESYFFGLKKELDIKLAALESDSNELNKLEAKSFPQEL